MRCRTLSRMLSLGFEVLLGCLVALLDLLAVLGFRQRRSIRVGRKWSKQSAVGTRVGFVCELRSSVGQPSRTVALEELTMPRQCIETRKGPMTVFTLERLDSSMQLHMSLAIVLSRKRYIDYHLSVTRATASSVESD
jgi:hypothetical protein